MIQWSRTGSITFAGVSNTSQIVRSAILTGRTDPPATAAVPWPSLQAQFFTVENQKLLFQGSMFAGFRTVFGDEDKSVSSTTTLVWLDDAQLDSINMQPLGTPTYVVDVSAKWHQIR